MSDPTWAEVMETESPHAKLDRAIGAFFASLAASYPGFSGDLPPAALMKFESAAASTMRAWVEANVSTEKPVTHTVTLTDTQAGLLLSVFDYATGNLNQGEGETVARLAGAVRKQLSEVQHEHLGD